LADDIWYAYTASSNGTLTINTCGSSYDSVLAVYSPCTCPPGAALVCNDDFCGLQSQVSLSVTAGTCYLIQVGGFNGATGSGTLNVMGPSAPPVIAAANPPNLHLDPLQPGPGATVAQGIGAAGTPAEGTVTYAPIRVTFTAPPAPPPNACNVTVSCTGGACPIVTGVTAVNSTTFDISLSAAIPPLHCTTITFAGGQKVQYISHPGNPNGDGAANTIDILAIVLALNNGTANQPANISRYDIDRSHTGAAPVNTSDLLREVQLLNGTNTVQVYNGTTHAPCPP
jgi:hypothetical protein